MNWHNVKHTMPGFDLNAVLVRFILDGIQTSYFDVAVFNYRLGQWFFKGNVRIPDNVEVTHWCQIHDVL